MYLMVLLMVSQIVMKKLKSDVLGSKPAGYRSSSATISIPTSRSFVRSIRKSQKVLSRVENAVKTIRKKPIKKAKTEKVVKFTAKESVPRKKKKSQYEGIIMNPTMEQFSRDVDSDNAPKVLDVLLKSKGISLKKKKIAYLRNLLK